ncbi:MAG TPA: hypothetical protein VIL66_07770 [Bacillota bacterium]
MRSPLVIAGNVLLLLLLLFLAGSVMGHNEVGVPRVRNISLLELGADDWRNKLGQTQISTTQQGVGLQVYTAYDEKNLYLGFYVIDPFLTFKDDYSENFSGSDHLRVYLKVDKWLEKAPLILDLLPTSKIKEPLLKVSGLSWRSSSFQLKSVLQKEGYFLKLAVPLQELKLLPLPGERIRLNCRVNNVTKNGASPIWLLDEETNGLELILE